MIGALAITEPNTGSDVAGVRTTAVRHGDTFVVNGAKTFISNGINSDIVVTTVKTDTSAGHRGMSLLVLERGMPGFERGRNLDKLGMHAQDTAELFFTDVEVPVGNLLGEGYKHVAVWVEPFAELIKVLLLLALAAAMVWVALKAFVEWSRSRS